MNLAGKARLGAAGQGTLRHVMAWRVRARPGRTRLGLAGPGSRGIGLAWPVLAGLVRARHGEAGTFPRNQKEILMSNEREHSVPCRYCARSTWSPDATCA